MNATKPGALVALRHTPVGDRGLLYGVNIHLYVWYTDTSMCGSVGVKGAVILGRYTPWELCWPACVRAARAVLRAGILRYE